MLTLDTSDLRRLTIGTERAERQLRFATAVALTRAMGELKTAQRASMRAVFDRPTRYTLNALAVIPATKDNLGATPYFREFGGTPPWKYLGPQILGGPREHSGSSARSSRSAP